MDTEYSALTISIPRVKVNQLEKDSFLYQIDVATRWAKWHLEKRYSQFQQLHKYLLEEFNDLPEFPESIMSSMLGESEGEIEEYRDILEDYLRITSLRKDIINSEIYSEFLQLDKHSRALLVNKPKFEGEFQLEEKINDDSKVIVDFYYSENYFVFATGNNSALQKFNALIANTKFPWEDDEDAEFILPLGTVQCWKLKKKPYGYSRIWARNYPVEVTKLLFSPDSDSMIVGLASGEIQIFKLIQRANNIYYEVVKSLKHHEDSITGLYLDKINKILFSSSIDGFLNICDAKMGVLINSLEFNTEITSIYGENSNSRLIVALGEGNMQVYEYNSDAIIRKVATLSTPDSFSIRTMLMDRVKNYFFAAGHDSGSIYIYDLPKPGNQKLMKQVAALKNKQGVVSLHFIPQKMELIAATESGQIFFWDCVKGKQIYMLKPFEQGGVSHTHYIHHQKLLITAQKGRLVKFWSIPNQWRDASVQIQQEKEIQIRRKVQNLYRVRQAIKRKENDSDDDDLACWYRSDSSSSQEQGWFNFEI